MLMKGGGGVWNSSYPRWARVDLENTVTVMNFIFLPESAMKVWGVCPVVSVISVRIISAGCEVAPFIVGLQLTITIYYWTIIWLFLWLIGTFIHLIKCLKMVQRNVQCPFVLSTAQRCLVHCHRVVKKKQKMSNWKNLETFLTLNSDSSQLIDYHSWRLQPVFSMHGNARAVNAANGYRELWNVHVRNEIRSSDFPLSYAWNNKDGSPSVGWDYFYPGIFHNSCDM